jgi:vancomycin permeability regulator SanA
VSGLALGGTLLGASMAWVRVESHGDIYSTANVPAAPVAVVLGDLVYTDGQPSAFLLARLEIARTLYDTGKVEALLVSGDNSRADYDEPDAMGGWLVAHGVPAAKVVTDHAGFDTYASCVWAYRIFGVRQAIIVSQRYHLPRAVAICRHEGIRATGVGDSSVSSQRWTWWRAVVPEQFADVKAVFDVGVDRRPVLGRTEPGVTRAVAAPR